MQFNVLIKWFEIKCFVSSHKSYFLDWYQIDLEEKFSSHCHGGKLQFAYHLCVCVYVET